MTLVREVMTRDPISVSPAQSVQEAARLMDEFNVGALPVCEGDVVVGIVTDRDITVRATAAGLSPARTSVERVMTDRVRCCAPQQDASQAMAMMSRVQIRRLPVVDPAQRLVGMVSLGDCAERDPAAALQALHDICTPARPDRQASPGDDSRDWAAAA